MTISPEWAAVALTVLLAIAAGLGWLLRQLREEIAQLKLALANDLRSQADHIQRLDDRLRQHSENEDRHTSKTARDDYQARLRRIEDLLEKLLLQK